MCAVEVTGGVAYNQLSINLFLLLATKSLFKWLCELQHHAVQT